MTGRGSAFPLLVAFLLLGAAAGAARALVLPPTPETLARDVDALAAPQMEGRRAGTPGGERAARRIAEWLEAAGLRPGGERGTFFQWFVVETGIRLGPSNELALGGMAARRFDVGREWTPHGGSLTGAVTGEVVFAGWGAAGDEWSADDYAGLDVRGRIVIARDGTPPAPGAGRVSRLDKLITARQHGASALLLVADALPSLQATSARVGLISGTLTPEAARALKTGDRLSLRVDLAADERRAANVVGILPGTDPALADEAVVIGAHYDHLGSRDGVLYPGADDNASGTAMVVGLARAWASAGGAPRTLVVALFGGEELGLLGSRHYVRRPALPLERTVAMVNFDMVGRMRDRRLIVAGADSAQGLAEGVTAAAGPGRVALDVSGNPWGASDHSPFYEAGIPVLFLTTGTHEDYHRPSDTADKIDAAAMAEIGRISAGAIERLAGGARPVYARVARPPRGPAEGGAQGSAPSGAFLGIVVGGPRADGDGLRVASVLPGSAAARAGLGEGDVIVRLGGTVVDGFDDLRAVLRSKQPGDAVRVVYLRDGLAHTTSATLGVRP
ncbi:MAG: hypothetical protein DMD92_15595 [Candidatus Rokuibacteriota bacterium]|nr:MAG: hypothetical protein DMD92_15595 [Candidatus Rokubacteria bacterium]